MFEASVYPYQIAKIETALARLLSKINGRQLNALLGDIGALIKAQTKRRIAKEKTSPSGVKWKPWSQDYRRTRKRRHSLLIDTGHMLDSIDYILGDKKVIIGAGMNYAVYQQSGRPFLGVGTPGTLSRRELLDLVADFTKRELFF